MCQQEWLEDDEEFDDDFVEQDDEDQDLGDYYQDRLYDDGYWYPGCDA